MVIEKPGASIEKNMSIPAAPSIFDLSQRRLWVFGGAGYLGRAVVSALDSQNADVMCIDLEDRAQAFIAEWNLSSRAVPVSLNVIETDEVLAWIQKECEAGRSPHGAVFLTTPLSGTPLDQLTREELTSYNEAGLSALFCVVREVGSAMVRQGGGSLVLFSSMYGLVAPDSRIYEGLLAPNPIQYGMQKAAIDQMMRYLAVTWGKHAVRCNSVIPGPFPNLSVQKNHPEFVARLADKTPMGRIGKADEIAGAVAFLLSDAATYINGHGLVVDGGWTAW
mgnify:CR=1 FL=1|jgi:NAD(P)-dependent dehydrogenase (short-subunit alcohol dehydrogenase family)